MSSLRDQLIITLGETLENLQAGRLDPLGVDHPKLIDILDLGTRIIAELLLEAVRTALANPPSVSAPTPPPTEPNFVLAAAQMRRLQKAFLAHGQRNTLLHAQEVERQVDRMIDEMTSAAASIFPRSKGGG